MQDYGRWTDVAYVMKIQKFISERDLVPLDIDNLKCTTSLDMRTSLMFAEMSRVFDREIYFIHEQTSGDTVVHFTHKPISCKTKVIHRSTLKTIARRCKGAVCGPQLRSTLVDTMNIICGFKSVHFVPSFSFENIRGGVRLIVYIARMTASDIDAIMNMNDIQDIMFSLGYLQCDFHEQSKRTRSHESPTPDGLKRRKK